MDNRRVLGADYDEDLSVAGDEFVRDGQDELVITLRLIELFQGVRADFLRANGAVTMSVGLGCQVVDA